MKALRVYLCSRVAYDARPLNEVVAKSLRSAGFYVYVPHEVAPNNLSKEDMEAGRFDKEAIFQFDFGAMQSADVCVVVGRFGKDCSFEIGWFTANEIPIVHVPADDTTWETSPMCIPSLLKKIDKPETAGDELRAHFLKLEQLRITLHETLEQIAGVAPLKGEE